MARRAVDAIFAFRIARPVGGGPAPYVGAIARPFVRIAGAIGALRQRRAAAVLEIIDTLAAHEIVADAAEIDPDMARSEEHTSELQSLMRISYAVFCLKKKKKKKTTEKIKEINIIERHTHNQNHIKHYTHQQQYNTKHL